MVVLKSSPESPPLVSRSLEERPSVVDDDGYYRNGSGRDYHVRQAFLRSYQLSVAREGLKEKVKRSVKEVNQRAMATVIVAREGLKEKVKRSVKEVNQRAMATVIGICKDISSWKRRQTQVVFLPSNQLSVGREGLKEKLKRSVKEVNQRAMATVIRICKDISAWKGLQVKVSRFRLPTVSYPPCIAPCYTRTS